MLLIERSFILLANHAAVKGGMFSRRASLANSQDLMLCPCTASACRSEATEIDGSYHFKGSQSKCQRFPDLIEKFKTKAEI
jgi:hypothetical protein